MTPKLAAVRAQTVDEAALRRALDALGTMRRSGDPKYILDVLGSTARILVPDSSVWAALQRPAHDGGYVATSHAPGVDVATTLESWSALLREDSTSFEAESSSGERLTVFRVSSGERLGALVVAETEQGLGPIRRSLLGVLAEHASMALGVGSAHAAAHHTEALFETMAQLSASYTDAGLVLDTIVRRTASLLDMDAAWVMLTDPEKKRLSLTTSVGITSPTFAEMSISVDDLMPGAAIRKRRVVVLRDAQGDEQSQYSRHEGLRTVYCAPMFVEDELMGVLVAAHREIRDASAEDRRIMMALASAAAVSIGNARLYADREVQSQALQQAMHLQKSLTTLVLEGSGLDEIIRVITGTLGCAVLVLDGDLMVLHDSEAEGESEITQIDVDALRAVLGAHIDPPPGPGMFRLTIDPPGREVVVAPLGLAGEPTAYVVLAPGTDDLRGVDLGMTESAVTAIALELMRDRAAAEAEARLTGGLFQTLLSGDDGDDAVITRRASYLGYELSGANVVIAVTLPDGQAHVPDGGQSLLSCIQRAVRRHASAPTAVFEHAGSVFVLLSDPETVAPPLVKMQCSLIVRELAAADRFADARIAFAGPHQGVAGVRRGVGEATHALNVLGALGKTGTPVAFGDLGVWTLLGGVGDRDRLLGFAHGVLGELIAHDAERQSQLVETLRALVQCNFHLRPAAERLFVHPNTLRYRMPRITELTGLDLGAPDDRLKADIALRILDVVTPPA